MCKHITLYVKHIATQSVHDMEPLQLDEHGSYTQKHLQPLLSSSAALVQPEKLKLMAGYKAIYNNVWMAAANMHGHSTIPFLL